MLIIIRIYMGSTEQRRLENTFKLLEFIRQSIGDNEIITFVKLFHANSELIGANYNEFKFPNGKTDTIETMFSEGGCGNGDIYNMIVTFNAIVPLLKTTKNEIIWCEYGQIMSRLFNWTEYLEKKANQDNNISFYSNFNTYMRKNARKILSTPYKYYTYAEL